MKKITPLLVGLLAFHSVVAQEEAVENLTVPLSDPGKRGYLELSLVKGDIKIEAYDGKEVLITARAGKNRHDDDCSSCDDHDYDHDYNHKNKDKDKDKDKGRDRSIPAGMKRIATSPVEISASQHNNRVDISTNSWKTPINIAIKLPSNFDLHVSTVNGILEISGINGNHEISGVNGGITVLDITGSVVSNTVNGDIVVEFNDVNPEVPMSFVTLNGDVDVTLPADIKGTAKMKSDRGEIFTDFDLDISKSKPEVNVDDGDYRVSVNSWVFGSINGGGPEYTFKNMQGNVIIRKK